MKANTILTRRRFSVWWEYARQWMFRTLVTKEDLKGEIGEVAKESTSQEILTAVQSAPVIPLTNDQVEAIINHVINS